MLVCLFCVLFLPKSLSHVSDSVVYLLKPFLCVLQLQRSSVPAQEYRVSYQETGVRQISRRGGAVQCNAHAYIIMGEVSAGLHIEVSQGIRYTQWCCSLIRTLEVCIIDFMIIYTSCGRSI